MLVFSDLDRSIIFSNKFIDTDIDYTNIEVYEGKEISYISKFTIDMIREIQKNGVFIPTTTRTVDQFDRIGFSEFNIEFQWVIAANGGIILKDGEVLGSWKKRVDEILLKSKPIDKVIERFKKYENNPGILKLRKAEELFFYLVVDLDIFKFYMIEGFIEELDSLGWKVYFSGRKIYFLPKGITKENAVKYLSDNIGVDKFYTIGDSFMDEGMLSMSSNPFTLKHGELAKVAYDKGFALSKLDGMKGTEEVLKNIIQNGELSKETNTARA